MKFLIFAVLLCMSSSVLASQYRITCNNPSSFKAETYSDDVIKARTENYGTVIFLKDGTVVRYSIAIPCVIVEKPTNE